MKGISMDQPAAYRMASLRYFEKNEYHVSRFCEEDVLLLVYDGVLRFTENGIPYEVGPGSYHIQQAGTWQTGHLPSDAPKYLYVHFRGEWAEEGRVLPFQGSFDCSVLQSSMETLNQLAHSRAPYLEQAAVFLEILSFLYRSSFSDSRSTAGQIAEVLSEEYLHGISLEQLAKRFHFSKNYIIQLFKAEYGMTPVAFIHELKLKRAEYLMIVTSESIERISEQAGFQTYAQFYKLFFRKNGVSPSQWRKQKQI